MERELTMDLPSLELVFIVILVKELVAEKEVKASSIHIHGRLRAMFLRCSVREESSTLRLQGVC